VVVYRPVDANLFEVVVVAALRAKQLMRGCTPRVPRAVKFTTTARREVVAAKVLFHCNGKPAAVTVSVPGGSHALPL
jgi:DNA-directed RNA polymerase subunit K/omega